MWASALSRKGGPHAESVIFEPPGCLYARHVEFDRRIAGALQGAAVIGLLESDELARILRSTVSRRSGKGYSKRQWAIGGDVPGRDSRQEGRYCGGR